VAAGKLLLLLLLVAVVVASANDLRREVRRMVRDSSGGDLRAQGGRQSKRTGQRVIKSEQQCVSCVCVWGGGEHPPLQSLLGVA
jgi:hypothetical protein